MDEQRTVPFANYPYEREWGDSNRITREYFDSLLLEMRHPVLREYLDRELEIRQNILAGLQGQT